MLTHAIAPAPSSDWQNVFEKNVSKRNRDGTPSKGSIVVHFGINADIRTLTEGNLQVNLFNATNEEGMTMYKVKQPKDMYEILQPGLIIALKKGKSLFAWAEITSSYYYLPEPKWAHRWDYKILRMADKVESVRHEGWMKTFHMNAIIVPADVLKIQAMNNLRQNIIDKSAEKTLLYNKMQEAIEAFRASEDELNSLERTLELSGVI